jgi:hypothetical protein
MICRDNPAFAARLPPSASLFTGTGKKRIFFEFPFIGNIGLMGGLRTARESLAWGAQKVAEPPGNGLQRIE